MDSTQYNLLSLSFVYKDNSLSFNFSWILLVVIILVMILIHSKIRKGKNFKIVDIEMAFGGVGKIKIAPKIEDIQFAHKIWTQLVTRKAAIEIDENHDLIHEVYNSWYAIFGYTRDLIANVPVDQIKANESTRELIQLSTKILNNGLRPHLTKWQGKYRNWYETNKDALKKMTPQEYQKTCTYYNEIMTDIKDVNKGLIV